MPRPSKPDAPSISIDELASYIAAVSGELAHLAGRAGWPLLTYFLNMARVEAEALIVADTAKPPSYERPEARPRNVSPNVRPADCG